MNLLEVGVEKDTSQLNPLSKAVGNSEVGLVAEAMMRSLSSSAPSFLLLDISGLEAAEAARPEIVPEALRRTRLGLNMAKRER